MGASAFDAEVESVIGDGKGVVVFYKSGDKWIASIVAIETYAVTIGPSGTRVKLEGCVTHQSAPSKAPSNSVYSLLKER
jgi:hypothetical protein